MSTQANKEVVRRFFAAYDAGDLATCESLLVPELVVHGIPGLAPGRAAFRQQGEMWRAAFPDEVTTLQDEIAEDDRVAVRLTQRATHTGDFMGIPATGKPINYTAVLIFRLSDGLIAEHWVQFDQLGMLQQLGVIPDMAPASA